MQDTPFSGEDDCERGAMCWNVDEGTLMGECVGLCTGSVAEPGCVDACAECFIPAEGVLNLCFASCDPVAQDCSGSDACYLVNDGYLCSEPDADAGVAGDSCEFFSDCAEGYTCIGGAFVPGCSDGEGCCTAFCTAGDAGACDDVAGSTCSAVFDPGEGPACVADSTGLCTVP